MTVTIFAIAAAFYASSAAAQDVTITASTTLPSGASQIVDKSFVGYGIEMSSLTNYTGTDASPSLFSRNMLAALSNRTGSPVFIRVGGTSMDNSQYDPSQPEPVKLTGASNGLQTDSSIGRVWTQSFGLLPNVKWTLMVPLGRKNISNAVLFARDCVAGMGGLLNLESLEIGNEPNLYVAQDLRDGSWTPDNYTRGWTDFARRLSDGLALPDSGGPWYQGLALASSVAAQTTSEWYLPSLIARPFLVNSTYMKTVSHHYYQADGNSNYDLATDLMNHKQTTTKLDAFRPSLSALTNTGRLAGISLALGEVGSSIGPGKTGTNSPILDGSLGSSLWTVDFMLYAMALSVRRVSMQLGASFAFAAWHPIPYTFYGQARGPNVNGNWYGQLFAAEFLGSTPNLRVAEYPLPGNPNFAAYGGYYSGRLAKVAIVNLQLYTAASGGSRPQRSVVVQGLGSNAQRVEVKRLTGRDGVETTNITWGGERWTAASQGLPVSVVQDTQVLSVAGGRVEVQIQASEALLLTLVP